MKYTEFALCLINSLRTDQNFIICFCSVILNKFSFFFTIIILSLYVVNDIIYIFGVKYISFKRIIIEFLMEGLIYCIILNYELLDNEINNFNVFLNIISILDIFYYVATSYFYDKDKEEKSKHIISKKIFQVLGVVIIIMEIYQLILNSFNYNYCIDASKCLLPAVFLLIEPCNVSFISTLEISYGNSSNGSM